MFHPDGRAGVTIPHAGIFVLISPFGDIDSRNFSNKFEDRKFAIASTTVHLMFGRAGDRLVCSSGVLASTSHCPGSTPSSKTEVTDRANGFWIAVLVLAGVAAAAPVLLGAVAREASSPAARISAGEALKRDKARRKAAEQPRGRRPLHGGQWSWPPPCLPGRLELRLRQRPGGVVPGPWRGARREPLRLPASARSSPSWVSAWPVSRPVPSPPSSVADRIEWPGSKIRAGKISTSSPRSRPTTGSSTSRGRMWITEYPPRRFPRPKSVYSPAERQGEGGCGAYQAPPPRLPVPSCNSSQWFECPRRSVCSNQVGEKKGPGPCGMDWSAMGGLR